MSTVEILSREYFIGKFAESDAAAEREEARRQAERRKTETTYRIDPHEPAKLIDELRWWSDKPRPDGEDAGSLGWAIARLETLGFERADDGLVVSFRRRMDGPRGAYCVYADPRAPGKLQFAGFKITPKGLPGRTSISFDLADRAFKDLPGTLEAAFAKA